MLKFTSMLAVLVGLFVTPASGSIIYSVDRDFGGATLSGTITMSGTVIDAWSFTTGEVIGAVTFSNTDSGASSTNTGGILSVTPTELVFDFGASSSAVLEFISGDNFWKMSAAGGSGSEEISACDFCFPGPASVNEDRFVSETIATAEVASSVPEPASLAIFGLGLAGLGLMRRRKVA